MYKTLILFNVRITILLQTQQILSPSPILKICWKVKIELQQDGIICCFICVSCDKSKAKGVYSTHLDSGPYSQPIPVSCFPFPISEGSSAGHRNVSDKTPPSSHQQTGPPLVRSEVLPATWASWWLSDKMGQNTNAVASKLLINQLGMIGWVLADLMALNAFIMWLETNTLADAVCLHSEFAAISVFKFQQSLQDKSSLCGPFMHKPVQPVYVYTSL